MEQAATTELYIGEAEGLMKTKVGNLRESQYLIKQVIHQLIQSPIFTVPVSSRMRQYDEIAGTREVGFWVRITKQESDNDYDMLSPPLTGCFKDSLKISKDVNKKYN